MKLLSLLFVTIAFSAICQEDFRLRPWSDCNDYEEQSKIVIIEDGKVLAFPQHIYKGELTNETTLFCIVDKEGKQMNYSDFQYSELRKLRKNLESIKALSPNLKSGTPEYKKREAFINLFKECGLDFDDYLTAVGEILKGKTPRNTYAPYFPGDLHNVFKDSNQYLRKINIKIEGKTESGSKCECANSTENRADSTIIDYCKGRYDYSRVTVGLNSFEVRITNPLSVFIFDQLITFKEKLNDLQLENSLNLFDSNLADLKAIKLKLDSIENNSAIYICSEDFGRIEAKLTSINNTNYSKSLDLFKDWKLSWIWFTNDIVVDPFMGKMPPQSRYTKKDLTKIENRIKAHELLLGSGSVPIGRTAIDTITTEYAQLIQLKNDIEDALKAKSVYETAHKQRISSLAESTIVYQGQFYVSSANDRYVMRNHDASNDYGLLDIHREGYYDYEDIEYLVHNVTDKNKLTLKTSGTAITSHSPAWVEDVGGIFDELSLAYDVEVPDFTRNKNTGTSSFSNLNLSRAPQGPTPNIVTNDIPCLNQAPLYRDSIRKVLADKKLNLNELIQSIQKTRKAMDSLSGEFSWIKTLSTIKQPKPVLGHSVQLTSTASYKKPAQVSYDITRYKADNKEVEKVYTSQSSFSHYKRKYVQLYAGINFSVTPVNRVIIDEDVMPLDPKIEATPIQFSAGLKFYPFGGVIEDNRFFAVSRYRFHVVAGLGIPKPLQNIYLGLGYDVIPGLSIHANCHFFQNTEYIISNGEVTSSRLIYQPALNFGVGVDASIFVKAVKFFTK